MKRDIKKNNYKLVSNSEAETMKIAAEFSKTLRGGEIILLDGELGAGKSTFVRGLARAFGIREPIRSPTFTLMHVHKVKKQRSKVKGLVHIDAYRLRGAEDLQTVGLEEYLGRDEVVILVEWGKKVARAYNKYRLTRIVFGYGKKETMRRIKIFYSSHVYD